MQPAAPTRRLTAVACAALAVLAAGAPARAAVTTTGSVASFPNGFAIGPGDTDTGDAAVVVGASTAGTLRVDAGSLLRANALVGASFSTASTSSVVVTGAGSRVLLLGDPLANGWLNRLEVAAWGRGSLTVADGGLIDTTLNTAPCVGNAYCNTFVGNFAGADATFTITGAGSEARILRTLYVGGVSVFKPPQASFTAGTPGGVTTGRVNVLDGGLLRTEFAVLGMAPGGTDPTGRERSFAEAVVDGTGSLWRVVGGSIDPTAAYLSTATHRNAWASLAVTGGGTLRVEGSGNAITSIGLTTGGGRTEALVSGGGSNITFAAQSGVFNIGRSLGSAVLEVRDGGLVDNVWYTGVGRDGSNGTLIVDGNGTRYRANGTATAAANGVTGAAVFDIGRNGGNGTVNVVNGGRLEVTATTATASGLSLSLGRDAASSGTLNIGSGGTVLLSTASVAPDSAGEAWNPFVRVGRDGSGTLAISGGGKLLVEGNAVSTPDFTRRTSVFIGGSGDAAAGGKGIATVTGAGSELRVSGADAYIGVGHGPQAVGSLAVSDRASIGATILGVGNFGGTGIARLDNASVNLTGQYTGSGQYAAALVVGAGAGAVGNLSATNGTTIRIDNRTGSAGGGVAIGGSSTLAGGDGSVSLSGGSSIQVLMPAGTAGFSVGRSGGGVLRMQGASSIDIGDGSFYVARQTGSDGTVIATGGSTITAGWVGVGRNRTGGGTGSDGGTGTMVLNGATLNATDVVIGTNGFLGGTAGAINVSGSVVNYGTFSPGNSPGLFTINGNYVAGAGSRLILEVAEDGHGGFITDLVRFGAGSTIDLHALSIEFRFLGAADPAAFLNAGLFDVDTFVQQGTAGGGFAPLDDAAYDGVSFDARSDAYAITTFSYSAGGTASFALAPVPEPASWAMLLAGVAALAGVARRRAAR